MSIKPEVIRYNHISNINDCKINLESMGKKLFGKEWLGFVEEITFIHSKGYITKKIIPIKGSPIKEFTKLIKQSGIKIPDFSSQKGERRNE